MSSELFQIKINDEDDIRFVSKRVEGQFGESLEIEFEEGESHAEIKREFRDSKPIDYYEEINVFENLLEGMSLSELEEQLRGF